MWKEYSRSYMKNNRASAISILASALVSALFLAFLCSLFYNFWHAEIDHIIREEGDWQGRITGRLTAADISLIEGFANVEKVVVSFGLSEGEEVKADIYFKAKRTIFQDMPLITDQLGLEEGAADYHLLLLSRYFIHDPQDPSPPLLMSFFMGILVTVSFSLIMIIHNSFAVSMEARIHQFGILSSVGATPRQIRICLIQEALILSLIPVILGNALGIGASYVLMQAINVLAEQIPGAYASVFSYHPAVFAVTFSASALTIFFSALMPAVKLSRMTPLEAIRNAGGLQLKKKKRAGVLSLLFGIEGELAANALAARKTALRTSSVSLTLSFLGFTVILCYFTLSQISTHYTYFERYRDAWDIMVTVRNTKLEDFDLTAELNALAGVEDCVVYQKSSAATLLPKNLQSDELTALGGFGVLTGADETAAGTFTVTAPLMIMDDNSYLQYCTALGIEPQTDGTIVLNRIWDSRNSNFRYREYIPFIKTTEKTIALQGTVRGNPVRLPVLAYTQEAPALREEYGNYTLVQFISLSTWIRISGEIGEAEKNTYVRILADDDTKLAGAKALEIRVAQFTDGRFEIESENRISEKVTNDYMILGYLLILGGICVLLALIGVANVFSDTLGFMNQRKREFARYLSVGMTSAGMRKMFCAEALVIAGRPLLITVPLTFAFVQFAAAASYLDPMEFWVRAPVIPTAVFGLAIFGSVGLAYYIGGRRILNCNLIEALRNDRMM